MEIVGSISDTIVDQQASRNQGRTRDWLKSTEKLSYPTFTLSTFRILEQISVAKSSNDSILISDNFKKTES